jgi:hypothetical protein
MRSVVTSLGIGRAYQIRWSNRVASLFWLMCGTGFLIFLSWSARDEGKPLSPWSCLMLGVVVLIAGFGALSNFYNRVTLYADALEYRTVWSTSWLPFTGIRSRGEYTEDRGRWGKVARLCIVPNDESLPRLDFARSYNFDDAFWAWFNSLPDLKHVSQPQSTASV